MFLIIFSFCYSWWYDLNVPRWVLYFILLCLTAMVSYNVVVGDTVTKVLVRIFALPSQSLLASRNFVVFLATVTVTIPLCLQVWIQYWSCLSTHNYMYCDSIFKINMTWLLIIATLSGHFFLTVAVNGFCKYSYLEILLALKFYDIIILMFLKAKTVSHF